MTDGYVIMSITFALSHSMEALILPAAQRWLLKLIAEFSPICCLPLKKAPLATVAHPPCRQTASITDWNGGAKALTPQLSWYSKESFQLLNHLRPLLHLTSSCANSCFLWSHRYWCWTLPMNFLFANLSLFPQRSRATYKACCLGFIIFFFHLLRNFSKI